VKHRQRSQANCLIEKETCPTRCLPCTAAGQTSAPRLGRAAAGGRCASLTAFLDFWHGVRLLLTSSAHCSTPRVTFLLLLLHPLRRTGICRSTDNWIQRQSCRR